ncbi:MAG: NUDIX domain-containing protein [archaeon]
MPEMWDLVDENDEVVGTINKDEWWNNRQLHRGVTIILLNSEGKIFVHKRVENKKIYPGYYDCQVGGTVHKGETYDNGARREVQEEVGIENPKLEFLFKTRFKTDLENAWVKVYRLVYDGPLKLQKDEIAEGFWVTIDELKEMFKKEKFCDDALVFFKMYQELPEVEMRDIVDENDNVIDTMPIPEVRKKNLLRRGVTIYVFDSKRRIFVHKRTKNKKLYPNHYDVAVRGGVKAGETYEEAGKRELAEELGVEVPKLEFLFKKKNEYDQVNFIASVFKIVHEGPFKLNPYELGEGEFMTIEEINRLMKKEKFCPHVRELFEELENKFT